MREPCTHADAGEARERAAQHVRDHEAKFRRARTTTSKRARALELVGVEWSLNRYRRCPDCGRWREGA